MPGFSCGQALETDRYGRQIAVCVNENGDIGKQMVRNGLARAYVEYSRDYLADERYAINAGLGIWRGRHMEPWKWRRGERLKR